MPRPQKKSDAPALPSTSRMSGGRSTHLSPDAEALVVERILAGDTNVELNEALQSAKIFKPGETVSDRTLTEYRKSPAVKVSVDKLTEEARQAGHLALSEALVLSVRAMRTAARELLTPSGTFKLTDPQLQRNAAMVFFKSAEFLWSKLGYKDVLAVIEDGEKEALAAIEQSGADEATKAEYRIEVRENTNKALRKIIELQKQAAANALAQQVAEGTQMAGVPVPVAAPGASQ